MIRNVESRDIKSITEIYNYYIKNTLITFEKEVVDSNEMKSRIEKITGSNLPWLIYEENNVVLGYAYASQWKARCAYKFSVETTVYLLPTEKSKGLGTKLYENLFTHLKGKNIHAVIGGVSLPNPASIALHEKIGMEKVAHFKEVGFKFGKWVDVGYWQKNL